MMNIDQMLNEFRSYGFAEIALPSDIVNRLLSLAERFYAKPLTERLAIAAFPTHGILGYYPSETEAREIRARYGRIVPVLEHKRIRGYSSYDYIANEQILAASELFGANLWPRDEHFRIEACTLYNLVSRFMKDISQAIVRHLERLGKLNSVRRNAFDQECCSIMRLLKYTSSEGKMESKAHTDYEFISLICATAPGLEVQNQSGLWRTTPCNDGKAVILPGDMIEVGSSGWVQSTLHRVRFGGEDRLSVIFFQGLGLKQEIAYSHLGEQVVSTFGKHLCGMLVRGAPHLQSELKSWEQKLGIIIPEKNPFRRTKETRNER